VLQCVAVLCSVVQCVAVSCSVLHFGVGIEVSVEQVRLCRSVLQFGAVSCSKLQ